MVTAPTAGQVSTIYVEPAMSAVTSGLYALSLRYSGRNHLNRTFIFLVNVLCCPGVNHIFVSEMYGLNIVFIFKFIYITFLFQRKFIYFQFYLIEILVRHFN